MNIIEIIKKCKKQRGCIDYNIAKYLRKLGYVVKFELNCVNKIECLNYKIYFDDEICVLDTITGNEVEIKY